MGLAVHSWLPYLLVLQFGTFGFVGLQVYQQRVISQQLRELSWEPEPRCDCSGSQVTLIQCLGPLTPEIPSGLQIYRR